MLLSAEPLVTVLAALRLPELKLRCSKVGCMILELAHIGCTRCGDPVGNDTLAVVAKTAMVGVEQVASPGDGDRDLVTT